MVDVDDYPREQLFVHPEKPRAEKFEEPTIGELDDPGGFIKPKGGLWTSSYRDGTCGWLEWMQAEQWYMHGEDSRVWKLTVEGDPELYIIDSVTDAKALIEVYEGDLFEGVSMMSALDYDAIFEDYDAIWLTRKGQAETRFAVPTFYGWDCESTLWSTFEYFAGEPEELDIEVVDS